jgi:hypothetical protein
MARKWLLIILLHAHGKVPKRAPQRRRVTYGFLRKPPTTIE